MIVTQKNGFIVTREKGNLILWEKVDKGKNHIVFRHFEGVLYARYDSYHTPKGLSCAIWHDFQRAMAQEIIRQLVKLDWKQTTEERYQYMLAVLPPIYGNSFFAVDEPVEHNQFGQPVYALYKEEGGRFWESTGTLAHANACL